MWARVVAEEQTVRGIEELAKGAARVQEECDELVAAGEQLLANAALQAQFESALTCARGCGEAVGWGAGDDDDGAQRRGASQMQVVVAHALSRCIAFLLSRPWPVAARGGRAAGPRLALAGSARPWCEAIMGAVSTHVTAILREQGAVGTGARGDRSGKEKKKKKARVGKEGSVDEPEEGKAEGIGRGVGGIDVTLAVLSVLHEHLEVEVARAVVVAILELDLECAHTRELADAYGAVAARMIHSLSVRVCTMQGGRGGESARVMAGG